MMFILSIFSGRFAFLWTPWHNGESCVLISWYCQWNTTSLRGTLLISRKSLFFFFKRAETGVTEWI